MKKPRLSLKRLTAEQKELLIKEFENVRFIYDPFEDLVDDPDVCQVYVNNKPIYMRKEKGAFIVATVAGYFGLNSKGDPIQFRKFTRFNPALECMKELRRDMKTSAFMEKMVANSIIKKLEEKGISARREDYSQVTEVHLNHERDFNILICGRAVQYCHQTAPRTVSSYTTLYGWDTKTIETTVRFVDYNYTGPRIPPSERR